MESLTDDFDIEQAEIVKIMKSKERATETYGGKKFGWNKFNGDLVCRVVKEFLRKRLPKQVRIVGPNAYVDGYPVNSILLVQLEVSVK